MINIESVKAQYFDEKAIILPSYKLYMVSFSGKRYYYQLEKTDQGHEPVFYDGVTSFLGSVMPDSDGLKIWRDKMGAAEADAYMNNRALYGSLMHTVFTRLMIDGFIDLDAYEDIVEQYCQINKIPFEPTWAYELKRDTAAFTQWILDYDVKPILIESPLKHDILRLAGTCDLLCEMTIEEKGYFGEVYLSGEKKGQPKETKQSKRVIAVVDYKSNRSGNFYLSHELQLMIYEMLIRENFEQYKDSPIYLYNFSPKDWSARPDYHFRNQTDKHSIDVIYAYKIVYDDLVKSNVANRDVLTLKGTINLEESDPLENIVNHIKLSDHVRKNTKNDTPEIDPSADNREHKDRPQDLFGD